MNTTIALVQALRIPLVTSPASSLRAAGGPAPPLSTTLSPESRANPIGLGGLGDLGSGRRSGGGRGVRGSGSTAAATAQLALDECQSLLAVQIAVLLVVVGVVAGAAVGIRAVAVVLDAAAVGRADVAPGPSGETLRRAGAHVIREAGDVARRSHQDDGLDLGEGRRVDERGRGGDGRAGVGTAAVGVVEDLAALHVIKSRVSKRRF